MELKRFVLRYEEKFRVKDTLTVYSIFLFNHKDDQIKQNIIISHTHFFCSEASLQLGHVHNSNSLH